MFFMNSDFSYFSFWKIEAFVGNIEGVLAVLGF
jgi:hypothetical protein